MAEEERRVVVVWTLRDAYTPELEGRLLPAHRRAIEATKRGIRQFDLYGSAVRGAGREAADASLGFRRLGGILVSVSIMSFVANLMIRRLQHATLTLTEAQERYTEAVREHGPLSEEAVSAERRLRLARADLAIANREIAMQTVLYSLQLVVLSSRVLDTTKAFGLATAAQISHTISTTAATVTDSIHTGVLWVKAHALAFIKWGFIGLAAAMGAYIAVTTASIAQTRRLRKELGERPSTGLVKSLEDVQAVLGPLARGAITFEGAHLHFEGFGVEGAIDDYARYLKDEWRRRSPG